jgi:DNA (cytosine-5)-methyltransferase 1
VKALSIGGYYGGIGGALLGARWAGANVVYNHEPRKFFNLNTFKTNFPEAKYIEEGKFPKTDIIIGSPDCKQFSNLGTKRKDNLKDMDPFDFDYVKFLNFVGWRFPRFFILENVPNILNYLYFKDNYLYFSGWPPEKQVLWLKDYHIQTIILNAKDYGVPQSRRRAFIIGSRVSIPDYSLNTRWIDIRRNVGSTVAEAFKGIPDNQTLPNHSTRRIDGFKKLKVGESYYNTQNNKRLDPNKIAGTIASHCSRFVHPTEPRVLSILETARLMGFPDDFIFSGRESEVLDQMGKSIVPQIAFSLTSYLMRL